MTIKKPHAYELEESPSLHIHMMKLKIYNTAQVIKETEERIEKAGGVDGADDSSPEDTNDGFNDDQDWSGWNDEDTTIVVDDSFVNTEYDSSTWGEEEQAWSDEDDTSVGEDHTLNTQSTEAMTEAKTKETAGEAMEEKVEEKTEEYQWMWSNNLPRNKFPLENTEYRRLFCSNNTNRLKDYGNALMYMGKRTNDALEKLVKKRGAKYWEMHHDKDGNHLKVAQSPSRLREGISIDDLDS